MKKFFKETKETGQKTNLLNDIRVYYSNLLKNRDCCLASESSEYYTIIDFRGMKIKGYKYYTIFSNNFHGLIIYCFFLSVKNYL
jgi:hypothetical protein